MQFLHIRKRNNMRFYYCGLTMVSTWEVISQRCLGIISMVPITFNAATTLVYYAKGTGNEKPPYHIIQTQGMTSHTSQYTGTGHAKPHFTVYRHRACQATLHSIQAQGMPSHTSQYTGTGHAKPHFTVYRHRACQATLHSIQAQGQPIAALSTEVEYHT